jgi:hypothetical protein
VKTLTKDQHNADGRDLLFVALWLHGILRGQTSASRTPLSERAGRRRDSFGAARRFLRDAGASRTDWANVPERMLALYPHRTIAAG